MKEADVEKELRKLNFNVAKKINYERDQLLKNGEFKETSTSNLISNLENVHPSTQDSFIELPLSPSVSNDDCGKEIFSNSKIMLLPEAKNRVSVIRRISDFDKLPSNDNEELLEVRNESYAIKPNGKPQPVNIKVFLPKRKIFDYMEDNTQLPYKKYKLSEMMPLINNNIFSY